MEATIALAKVYENQKNYKKAIGLYKMASSKDNIEATIRLGELYEHGLGISINFDLAVEYYKKAEDNEHLVKIYEYIFRNKKSNTFLEEEFVTLDIKKYKLSDELLKIRSRLI
jgi:TPR repeat protein